MKDISSKKGVCPEKSYGLTKKLKNGMLWVLLEGLMETFVGVILAFLLISWITNFL